MKITVTIDTSNEAFGSNANGETGNEVARILQDIAGCLVGKILPKGPLMRLTDYNGNSVGKVTYKGR